jgi:hypothetical protein
MLRFLAGLLILHAIGEIAFAGNWIWIRAGFLLAVGFLGVKVRRER